MHFDWNAEFAVLKYRVHRCCCRCWCSCICIEILIYIWMHRLFWPNELQIYQADYHYLASVLLLLLLLFCLRLWLFSVWNAGCGLRRWQWCMVPVTAASVTSFCRTLHKYDRRVHKVPLYGTLLASHLVILFCGFGWHSFGQFQLVTSVCFVAFWNDTKICCKELSI